MTDLNDLAALYELDPLELTKEHIDTIIVAQRNAFGAFTAGVKDAGVSKTRKQKAADPQKTAAANDLLKGLGLI